MIIRKAEEKDVPKIAELEKICFSDPWSEESVRYDVSENKLSFYLVAEIDGYVAGYMGIWNDIFNVLYYMFSVFQIGSSIRKETCGLGGIKWQIK